MNQTNDKNFAETYRLIEDHAHRQWKNYPMLTRDYDTYDVINIVAERMWKTSLMEKHNDEVSTRDYFVSKIVKNQLIDMQRREKNIQDKYGHHSLNLSLAIDGVIDANDNSKELIDTLEGASHDEGYSIDLKNFYRKALAILPTDTKSTKKGFSPLLNREISLNQRDVVAHLTQGFSATDFARCFELTSGGKVIQASRVTAVFREGIETLKSNEELAPFIANLVVR